jgi:hypothetical protein
MENPHIPDAILGSWLYLGSKHTREREDILVELNIKYVLDFSQLENLEKFAHIEYVIYDVVDNETADIAKFFEVCIVSERVESSAPMILSYYVFISCLFFSIYCSLKVCF